MASRAVVKALCWRGGGVLLPETGRRARISQGWGQLQNSQVLSGPGKTCP